MYARDKLFIISLHTFEIPDFVRFQSPENRFSLSEPVRPLINALQYNTVCNAIACAVHPMFVDIYHKDTIHWKQLTG